MAQMFYMLLKAQKAFFAFTNVFLKRQAENNAEAGLLFEVCRDDIIAIIDLIDGLEAKMEAKKLSP